MRSFTVPTCSKYIQRFKEMDEKGIKMVTIFQAATEMVIIGKLYEIEESALYWEENNTDKTSPFLINSEIQDTTANLRFPKNTEKILRTWAEKSRMTIGDLVSLGIGTIFNAINMFENCELKTTRDAEWPTIVLPTFEVIKKKLRN